jgi:hypothetical protein
MAEAGEENRGEAGYKRRRFDQSKNPVPGINYWKVNEQTAGSPPVEKSMNHGRPFQSYPHIGELSSISAEAGYHLLRVNLQIFPLIADLVASIDRTYGFPLSALLPVGLPLVALGINALSVLHPEPTNYRLLPGTDPGFLPE